jgi:hypothetical protein
VDEARNKDKVKAADTGADADSNNINRVTKAADEAAHHK